MKKLILVVVLLVAVLLFSWWAKAANFNLFAMMQNIARPATPVAAVAVKGAAITPTPIPVEILITITPNGFVPDVIMVSPGTKITWVNKTPFTASISSNPPSVYNQLNLGNVLQNGSVSLTFNQDGRFNYVNADNPSQQGTIVVK